MISPVLERHTPPSFPYVLFYYTTIDHNNLNLPSPALDTGLVHGSLGDSLQTMSAKRSIIEAEAPHTATIPQPAKKTKNGTDIVLPADVWTEIVTFMDFKVSRPSRAPARRLVMLPVMKTCWHGTRYMC